MKEKLLYPEILIISVGGHMGPSYSVEWKSGGLQYKAIDRSDYEIEPTNKTVLLQPTQKQWEAFWRAVDSLNIWSWKKEYSPPPGCFVCDGTGWSISIKKDNYVLESQGYNAYPPDGGLDESRDFRKFCRAVSRLCGGRKFR